MSMLKRDSRSADLSVHLARLLLPKSCTNKTLQTFLDHTPSSWLFFDSVLQSFFTVHSNLDSAPTTGMFLAQNDWII